MTSLLEQQLEEEDGIPQPTALERSLQDENRRGEREELSVIPMSRAPGGDWEWDMGAGLPGMVGDLGREAWNLVMEPGRRLKGEATMSDAEWGMGTAAIFGPNSAASRVTRAIPGAARKLPKAPSTQTLKKSASDNFNKMRDTGAKYSGDDVGNFATKVESELLEQGYRARQAPGTFAELRNLRKGARLPQTDIADMHSARRALGRIKVRDGDETDMAAAQIAKGALDDFIGGAAQRNVATPNAARQKMAADLLKAGNKDHSAYRRAKLVDELLYKAELDTASAHSGQNLANQIRQKAKTILKSEKQRRGFTSEEIEALEAVVSGTASENTMRAVGNLLGGGGGMGSVVAGGGLGAGTYALTGDPYLSAAAGLAGAGSGAFLKHKAGKASQKSFETVGDLLRRRSDLYEKKIANALPGPTLERALYKTGIAGAGGPWRPELIRALMLQQELENRKRNPAPGRATY